MYLTNDHIYDRSLKRRKEFSPKMRLKFSKSCTERAVFGIIQKIKLKITRLCMEKPNLIYRFPTVIFKHVNEQ